MKKATSIHASRGTASATSKKHASKKAERAASRIGTPDFLANVKSLGYPKSVGDSLLLKFNDSLS
jgi:hypothetical protein